MKQIGVTGHQNKNYCKTNKSNNYLTDKNIENTKLMGLELKKKEKHDFLCAGFWKYIGIQQV